MQRTIVHFKGRVQGVGFRQTAAEMAQRFVVTGTVRNLPNGDVEMIVEGEAAEIQTFIDALSKRMGRYIESSSQRSEPAMREFSSFDVIR